MNNYNNITYSNLNNNTYYKDNTIIRDIVNCQVQYT